MMTGNTAIHIASQLQSGAPRKAAFLVAVPPSGDGVFCCALSRPPILRSVSALPPNRKHARRTAGLLRARVSSDSYDARRVRQLVRKQMLRFAASTPMGGVRAGGFAGLKRCG